MPISNTTVIIIGKKTRRQVEVLNLYEKISSLKKDNNFDNVLRAAL